MIESNAIIAMPELDKLAANSDLLETGDMAVLTRHRHATILKDLARNGNFYGIVPVRIGRKHLWPVAQVRALLTNGSPLETAAQ